MSDRLVIPLVHSDTVSITDMYMVRLQEPQVSYAE